MPLFDRWRFTLNCVGKGHWVSVARGPPEAAVDALGAFRASFGRPVMDDEEIKARDNPYERMTD